MSRAKKIIIAAVAVVVLAVGGAYGYIFFIRDDAPAALTTADRDQALDESSSGATVTDPTGTWNISTDSTVGYRVSEVLLGVDTEGAGRTNQVTGTLVIDGSTATSAEFSVDMASITSDDGRRDGQFRGRIMSTDQFPTSTFVLTSPIDFGSVPAVGQSITASATGDLTLRGVTRSVTFEVDAKLENGHIGVVGNIPISFSDYSIPDPSNQTATVKDNGSLEFVLVFEPA
jgi:polyisoprenoid-binding protein YceI